MRSTMRRPRSAVKHVVAAPQYGEFSQI